MVYLLCKAKAPSSGVSKRQVTALLSEDGKDVAPRGLKRKAGASSSAAPADSDRQRKGSRKRRTNPKFAENEDSTSDS